MGGWVGVVVEAVCDADSLQKTDHQQCGAQTLTYTLVH